MGVEIEGEEKIIKRLRSLSNYTRNNKSMYSYNAGEKMVAKAKRYVPVDTGTLQESIKLKVKGRKKGTALLVAGGKLSVYGKKATIYGPAVENFTSSATGKMGPIPQNPPPRWIRSRRSLKANQFLKKAKKSTKGAWAKGVKKYWAGDLNKVTV